jgi:ABC-type branched-subunit amino acid transport system ATPase component
MDERVIAIMGPAGAGKSSFIGLATGDSNVKVGHGLVTGQLLLYCRPCAGAAVNGRTTEHELISLQRHKRSRRTNSLWLDITSFSLTPQASTIAVAQMQRSFGAL